jgi:hypothetical protein
MSDGNDLYAFVLKGDLAQEAADREIGKNDSSPSDIVERISRALPLDGFDKDCVLAASKMAQVYTAIAAFETSARKFIQDRLLEDQGADWWTTHVSEKVRKTAEERKKDEEQHRYHGSRGVSMISYVQLGDLVSILQMNEPSFQDYIPGTEWARQIIKSLERSRNVIMHSGELSINDIERVGMNIRDWLRQVGG